MTPEGLLQAPGRISGGGDRAVAAAVLMLTGWNGRCEVAARQGTIISLDELCKDGCGSH